MVAEVCPLNVIARGEYDEMLADFSNAVEDCAAIVNCADFATYASLICTDSVPVRFEKWKRNLLPEKQARIG